jgi:YggT family protein
MSPLLQAALFLIKTLFDLYLFALLLRFIFQAVRADFFNPLSQLVVKVTNPPLIPLRRIIPGYKGQDMACLLLCLITCTLKLSLLFGIQFKRFPDPLGLILWSVGDLAKMTIYLFFFSILVQAVMSWVNPYGNHPLQGILVKLTSPVMRPFRRVIPPLGGFDISPIFAIIMLQILIIVVATPVVQTGLMLALK